MSKTKDEASQQPNEKAGDVKFRHPIHPYFVSNSREETLKRMRSFPERAAKFLEQWRADRETNSR